MSRRCAPIHSGALLALTGLAALAIVACHDDAAPQPADVTESRGDAVQAKAGTAPAASVPPVQPAAAPAPAKRTFCSGAGANVGLDVPDEPISRRSAASVPDGLPDLHSDDGQFTWINLWAAWCVPCKQELPLLRSWEKRLQGVKPGLRVAFVSLDDDDRQLDAFLKNQPTDGIKSTYWLREGKEREAWLRAAKIDVDTELPVHLLVDGKGKIRCFIRGAVEPDDFARLQQILGH